MSGDARKSRNWGAILVGAGKGLAKSLLLSAIVLGPGMLIMEEQRFLGWLWILVGSFAMMAWSYRKEWRMTWVGILIPPLAAIGAILVQLAVFGQSPSWLWAGIALVAGLAVGFARGETHQVFVKDNAIFAQRTIGFLGIWLLCYLITQYFSMMGQENSLAIGHASGAFSAAMLTMVAIMLRGKFAEQKLSLAAAAAQARPAPKRKTKPRKKSSSKSKAKSKRTRIGIAILLAVGIGSVAGTAVDARYGSVIRQPPADIYYDTPVPQSQMYRDGPLLIPAIEYINGCSVGLRLSKPNTVTPIGRPTMYTHFTSIRNYCSAKPASYFCQECQPAGVGAGVFSVPEQGAEAAAEAAVIASILILIGGSAVNIASSVAEAASRAAEAATDAGSKERKPRSPRRKPGTKKPRSSSRRKRASDLPEVPPKPPVIFNPYDQTPFETDDNGNYWAPNDKGEWVWMDANGAREAAAAMQGEIGHRDLEREDFERDSRQTIADTQARTRDRDDAERARIAAAEAARQEALSEQEQQDSDSETKGETESGRTKLIIDMISGEPGVDNTGIGWATNLITRWIGGSVIETGKLIYETPGALAGLVSRAGRAAWGELTNSANWEALAETGKDLVSLPTGDWQRAGKTARNVAGGGIAVGKVVAHLGGAAYDKGVAGTVVAVGKAVINVENWEKAIDPDVPVTERFGRAVWGTIDTGGLLIGASGAAAHGVSKVDDLIRGVDVSSDMARSAAAAEAATEAAKTARAIDAGSEAAKAIDATGDTARAIDASGDIARGTKAAEGAEDLTGLARAADKTGEVAATSEKTSDATRAAGRAAREADAPAPKTIEELRDSLRTQKRGALAEPGTGKNVERYGVPDRATDPEGYIRELPTGAIVDRNLANGSGYTGYQIDEMAKFAKDENVIVGARNTNVDSMRHIRDGNAVPKPLTIKAKTISPEDVYLGAKGDDKGLVGYFKPKKPDRAAVPDHMWDKVNARYDARLAEYEDLRTDVNRLIKEGQVVERDGKLQAVIRNADGTTTTKPYGGDIDGVYFKDGTTGELIGPGERYDRLTAAWTGNTKGAPDVPDYWARSAAPGQHGVETNVVADLTRGKLPGTPEYEAALGKARGLHGKLAKNQYHGSDFVLETDQNGIFRRGMRFSEDAPLPDLHAGT